MGWTDTKAVDPVFIETSNMVEANTEIKQEEVTEGIHFQIRTIIIMDDPLSDTPEREGWRWTWTVKHEPVTVKHEPEFNGSLETVIKNGNNTE